MAIKIYEKFAPRANPSNVDYPHGSIKNESIPGAQDGTPLDAYWGNDYAGADAALLAEAGITPSGLPDTALNSQRVEAIKSIIDLRSVTRSLNVLDSQVIYATDTVTALGSVLYIYDAATQKTWEKPANVGATEVIVTLVGATLTTTVGVYTLIMANFEERDFRYGVSFNTTEDMQNGLTMSGIKVQVKAGMVLKVVGSDVYKFYKVSTVQLPTGILVGVGLWADEVKPSVPEVTTTPIKKAAQYASLLTHGIQPKIACGGDSTMFGAAIGDYSQDSNNPPASLKRALGELYGININAPYNFAYSGTTMRGFITGGDGSGYTYEGKLIEGRPLSTYDIIYCNHGINDSQLDLSIDQYREDLVTFVTLTRKYSKVPILVTPNPNPLAGGLIDEPKGKRLLNFVNVMRSVAAQLDVDLVDQYYYFSKTASQICINNIIPDGAHLSTRAYRQAGYNMAIPLLSVNTLSKEGDVVGLTNTTYYDNATSARLVGATATRCGPTLSFNRVAGSNQGLSYPVILDNPQKCLSVIGLRWNAGTTMNVAVNGVSLMYQYSAYKNYGNMTTLDWDAETKVPHQYWAGLNIMGFIFDTATVFGGSGFAFSGLQIPKRFHSGKTDNAVVVNSKMIPTKRKPYSIGWYDSVNTKFNLTDTSSLVLADTEGNRVITVSKPLGILTAKLWRVDNDVSSYNINPNTFPDGDYNIKITINPSTVVIVIDNIALSINMNSSTISDVHVHSPWVDYYVRPEIEFVYP